MEGATFNWRGYDFDLEGTYFQRRGSTSAGGGSAFQLEGYNFVSMKGTTVSKCTSLSLEFWRDTSRGGGYQRFQLEGV